MLVEVNDDNTNWEVGPNNNQLAFELQVGITLLFVQSLRMRKIHCFGFSSVSNICTCMKGTNH
jgi:hypothetical protein